MQTSKHFVKLLFRLCFVLEMRSFRSLDEVINNSSYSPCFCCLLSERFEETHSEESIIKKAARALIRRQDKTHKYTRRGDSWIQLESKNLEKRFLIAQKRALNFIIV